MGLSQKQAVAVLYAVSAILGLTTVVLTSSGIVRIVLATVAFAIAVCIWLFVFRHNSSLHIPHHEPEAGEESEEKSE